MDIEQERNQFEAWYRQEHPGQVCEWVSGSKKHGSGYTNNHTKDLWKVWQARAAECRAPDKWMRFAQKAFDEIQPIYEISVSYLNGEDIKFDEEKLTGIWLELEKLLQSALRPEQAPEADSKPCCKNYFPHITDEMFESFGETDLMTWDRERNRPHWTQTAVDFAAELNVSGIHPRSPEKTDDRNS